MKRKTDYNGYAQSIFITEPGVCYCCNRETDTVRHEVLGGANRQLSKYWGLWINVCPYCHNLDKESIHLDPERWEFLKPRAQKLFKRAFPEEDFLAIFGKNYL